MGVRIHVSVRLLVIWALSLGVVLTAAPPAHAACHAFTVEADPADPAEGATVTLTIERDADVQPSSVRVRTVAETATGGADYTELDERVEFTEGTTQERQVDILDDDESEDDETFRVELSEGQGCEVNQSFTYDSVTVTIQDDDQPTEDDDPAADTSPTPESSPTPEETPTAETQDDVGDLPETGAPAAVGLGLLGALAMGILLGRRRER